MKQLNSKIITTFSVLSGIITFFYFSFNFAIVKVLNTFFYNVIAVIVILLFMFSLFLSIKNYISSNGGKKAIIPLVITFVFIILVLLSLWISPKIVRNVQFNMNKDLRNEVVTKYGDGTLYLNTNKITELPSEYSETSDLGKVYLIKHNGTEMILFFNSANLSKNTSECFIYTSSTPKDGMIDNAKIKQNFGNNWYYGIYQWQ